jgi:hypothetical protein
VRRTRKIKIQPIADHNMLVEGLFLDKERQITTKSFTSGKLKRCEDYQQGTRRMTTRRRINNNQGSL